LHKSLACCKIYQMSASEVPAIPIPASLEVLRPGDWVVRYTYQGESNSSRYNADVLVGEVCQDLCPVRYDSQVEGFVVPIAAAATSNVTRNYLDTSDVYTIQSSAWENTTYHHNQQLLLKGVIDGLDDINSAVAQLNNNDYLRQHGEVWQCSLVGGTALRLMQRSLFKAIGHVDVELQVPTQMRPMTHPELRADLLFTVAANLMMNFMAMRSELLD